MFEVISAILRMRKKHPHKPEDSRLTKRKELHSQIMAELTVLEKETEQNLTSDHSRRFYALVRNACVQAMGLKYEATFQEIQQEVKQRRYPLETQEKIVEFLNDLAILEYGYPQFKEVMKEKLQNREAQLREYIHDLEGQGERIKAETKKKIAQIVAETVPHSDKELLNGMFRRFREISIYLFH